MQKLGVWLWTGLPARRCSKLLEPTSPHDAQLWGQQPTPASPSEMLEP